MKKINYVLLLICMLMFGTAQAQTNDSTSMPWTSAPGLTNPIKAPAGALCGSATIGSPYDGNWTPCQGHYPLASCPANYYLAWLGTPAVYDWWNGSFYNVVNFYACVRA